PVAGRHVSEAAPDTPTDTPTDTAVDTTSAPPDEPAPEQDEREKAPRRPRRPRPGLPAVPPLVAAVVTGLVCGLAACLLAWLAARGCAAVRGVSTCGGFGLVALIAILGITVLIGSFLLRAWRVSDPTSTSFLAIGLVAVIAMLFFLDKIDSVWMVLVIPLLSAATFALSWWVTETFVEGAD
ncbi:MAG: hypothetical protein ACRDND_33240, partial [Streptosporangiaceae bacterium]